MNISGSVGELAILATNAAPGARAVSGNAIATNDAEMHAGPKATGLVGEATAAQVGDNRVAVDQTATATSGDAIAGSQVIGVNVGGDAGSLAVLASNGADGSFAASGSALAVNRAEVDAGPSARTLLGGANAAQIGDNRIALDQTATATTGDALAGSQVIGIVVGGEIGQSPCRRRMIPTSTSRSPERQSR